MTEPVSFGTTLLAIVLGIIGLIYLMIVGIIKLLPMILCILAVIAVGAVISVLIPVVLVWRWLTGSSHRLSPQRPERHGYSSWGR